MFRDWKDKVALIAVGLGLLMLVGLGGVLLTTGGGEPAAPAIVVKVTPKAAPAATESDGFVYQIAREEWSRTFPRASEDWLDCVAAYLSNAYTREQVAMWTDDELEEIAAAVFAACGYRGNTPPVTPETTCPPGYVDAGTHGILCEPDSNGNGVTEPPPLPDIPGCDPSPIGYSDNGLPIPPPCLDEWGSAGGDGPTALCNDGTYSYSRSASGTCSWHDGVREWY